MKRATKELEIAPPKTVISIHALVKRATTPYSGKTIYTLISIHALVKRATRRL